MNTDTPETDTAKFRLGDSNHFVVHEMIARKLERERDESRKWGCIRVFQLAQERDEIRTQLRKEQRLHIQTLNERDEARETVESLTTTAFDFLAALEGGSQ